MMRRKNHDRWKSSLFRCLWFFSRSESAWRRDETKWSPVNALHLYADDEFIKDKEWTTRLAGISEASNLIGYKLADQAKNIIVGIDECHQDKFPNLKFAMEQALNQPGSSSDLDEGHELESFEQDLRDQEPDVPLKNSV